MAETLATLRDRVEILLDDASNTKWTTTEIDEGIEQALDAYSERLPQRAIRTVTLASAGREIDISAISYRTIERVWWDYDSSDPAHPPRWREFEVWPGDLLYIDDGGEPAASDVVRIWYTTDQTLEDLNSAAATTFPQRHAGMIAQGAAGFAATQRRVTLSENVNLNEWAPRNLREWGEAQLAGFYEQLETLVKARAALAAGIAEMPALDRWDGDNAW